MNQQPFYFVAKPNIVLPLSIFDRDELTAMTDMQYKHPRILMDVFEKTPARLALFHYVIAVAANIGIDDVDKHLSSNVLNSDAVANYHFLSVSLTDLFLFVTHPIDKRFLRIRAFANWIYQELVKDFPQLFSDYTVVPQKDGTFLLALE